MVELKDKPIAEGFVAGLHPHGAPAAEPFRSTPSGDAVAALMGLGIAEVIARRAVDQAAIRLGEAAEVPALIKAALQDLGR